MKVSQSRNEPVMGMFETVDGGRVYMLCPVPPQVLRPALICRSGRIQIGYVVAGTLGKNTIYSEGSEATVRRHPSTHGFYEALNMMDMVWDAITSHRGPLDLAGEKRIADSLKVPETLLSYIEGSKVSGKKGGFRSGLDYLRNVVALAHWFIVVSIRDVRRDQVGAPVPLSSDLRGSRAFMLLTMQGAVELGWDDEHAARAFYAPGGMNWPGAARLINDACRLTMPPSGGWKWKEFTGKSLKCFYEAHGLFPPGP